MMEVNSIPKQQASSITMGNWILLHSGHYSFLWDAAGDFIYSSFIGGGKGLKL